MDRDIQRRLYGVFTGEEGGPPLADLSDALLAWQKESWPALEAGSSSLKAARVREIRSGGMNVQVQFNPQRIVSMGAAVDAESIRRRPCFLCPGNLPPEQRAILYRGEYLVLCNPAPIFPGHLTIVHRRHLPQALPEHLGIFLKLAKDFGPRMNVFYNGPRCGASAPDHLHFHAAPAGLMPVEKEVLFPGRRAMVARRNSVTLSRTAGLGRAALVIEAEDEADVAAAVGEVLRALGRLTEAEGEPMINLLCTHTGPEWRLIIFPRHKHRPDAYFREGEGKLLVSPGAVDMGGLLITSREEDFRVLNPELVRGIFREVAFGDAEIDALLDSL
ncbi:MAG: DUF4922 domain-containing protein [Proteobacteria bacterium]|nr:DUF4922 domain-containing protein [Pseudomonadota bacterium]MBU2226171.1 DUF4922 domain-containing protein [Pseudomonadota bacterium]MBU2261081.1 DUF4922 domain-containing protein [Pseudomonadota bacterium]